MHLTSVSIKNFRNLESVTLSLRPGLNVLVGRNNTGKTSIFDAIRLAVGQSAAQGETIWLEEDDFYRAGPGAPRAVQILIDLTFENLSEENVATFFEMVDFNAVDPTKSKATVHFEAEWLATAKRPTIKRWGGRATAEKTALPAEILQCLPVTFLPALRDAEAALTPGNRSRLALLLRDLARKDVAAQEEIVNIFKAANKDLETKPLVVGARNDLRESTKAMAGADYSEPSITAAVPEFERILRTLQIQMDGGPIQDLKSNGMGYNNLLFIATVLAHLSSVKDRDCPLLLVEEPEAHLHPQLIDLLARYLGEKTPSDKVPQTIVSTHSPTLAANVKPSVLSLVHRDLETKALTCRAVAAAGLTAREELELSRMLDVTRASLYFARGAILVEGISEAVLLPVLAARLGYDLQKQHVSVIPICGVAFSTFKKILSPAALRIPVAIITDGDPRVDRGLPAGATSWLKDTPRKIAGAFHVSDRAKALKLEFDANPSVAAFCSNVTLEYDLAAAGPANPKIMATVWATCFEGRPKTLKVKQLAVLASDEDRALAVWRGICRAKHTGSKAEFAQRLALALDPADKDCWTEFVVPTYLQDAIKSVVDRIAQ
jgi:putative ATP-dependent endonuclease of OLD family